MKRALAAAALLLTSCAGRQQSVVDAMGAQSERIASLWWFFLGLLTVIFLIVVALMLHSLTRRSRGIEQEPLELLHAPSADTERRLTRTVAGATILTILILFVLLISSVTTGKALSRLGGKQNALVVEVQGNQWWWYVRYMNSDSSRVLVTANEIHIPVGRPVMIRGTSNDVIHSFWVPNLHGKRDLIPSRVTTEWIEADRPGRFRGQCAEFCGAQHAHMSLWVVAEPTEQFARWMDSQLQPSPEPLDPVKAEGRQVFLDHACIFCHTIRGTPAQGKVAPDLTHFGSRLTLAAGTLPNTLGNLAGWIADPQIVKPGTHMATVPVPSAEMQPLIEYLESLK